MRFLAVFLLLPGWTAQAQVTELTVPSAHVPPAVVAELRALEDRFDVALRSDCAPERCFSKGCVYGDHFVVDKPRSTSLPGLGDSAGPGAVQPQEYLTRARCEFTYEPSVRNKDVNAIIKRLDQKLSKGWLEVTVKAERLSSVAKYLRDPPPEPAAAPPEQVPEKPAEPPLEPTVPSPESSHHSALRELWDTLLPHAYWMIGVMLLTAAALIIIWGLRRLGRESIEDQLMRQQLSASEMADSSPSEESNGGDGDATVELERRRWQSRMDSIDDSVIQDLVRTWLHDREFELLAKASVLFVDRWVEAFPTDGELTSQKMEFAQFLRDHSNKTLLNDEAFFEALNRHMVRSSLLGHEDAKLYQSLREELGPRAVAELVMHMPPRPAALLFSSVSPAVRTQSIFELSESDRVQFARVLLESNRASSADRRYLSEVWQAVRDQASLPPPPAPSHVRDRGQPFDAAGSLSVLLAALNAEQRQSVFASVSSNGSSWYQDIVYPELLMRLGSELRAEVLLESDTLSLAAWCLRQGPEEREVIFEEIPVGLRNAVEQSMRTFAADDVDIDEAAERGRREIARGMRKLYADGRIRFADLIA